MRGRPDDGTALLCLLVFCNTVCIGTFSPLLPEIGRTQALADWQLGMLAGAFGFARMIFDVPVGALAGRRLGVTLIVSPVILLLGLLLLATAGPFPILLLGRVLTGVGHTLAMIGGLTAVLRNDAGPSRSFRLNLFEFAGMLGILGGLGAVGVLPTRWGWPVSLLVTSTPALVAIALGPPLRRRFPDQPLPTASVAAVPSASRSGVHPIVWLMFAVGAVMSLAWSAINQFLIPLRGAREFGLDRGGVSSLLALSQLADLVLLLPVGWLADRIGRVPVLGALLVLLAVGTWGAGLGSYGVVIVGCVLFGMGMSGWMLPLGIMREHIDLHTLAWRTGLYRVGIDATSFLGPLICGLLGEAHTGVFLAAIGVAALAIGARLLQRSVV